MVKKNRTKKKKYTKKYTKKTRKYKSFKLKGGILPKKKRQKSIYNKYHLLKILDLNKDKIKIPDGQYDFIILNAKPDNIYLIKFYDGSELGHTSFPHVANNFKKEFKLFKEKGRRNNSKTDTVKYAGELIIKGNKLEEWNNISGHYMPLLEEATNTGLIMHKFKPYYEDDKLNDNLNYDSYDDYWTLKKIQSNNSDLSVNLSSIST